MWRGGGRNSYFHYCLAVAVCLLLSPAVAVRKVNTSLQSLCRLLYWRNIPVTHNLLAVNCIRIFENGNIIVTTSQSSEWTYNAGKLLNVSYVAVGATSSGVA